MPLLREMKDNIIMLFCLHSNAAKTLVYLLACSEPELLQLRTQITASFQHLASDT